MYTYPPVMSTKRMAILASLGYANINGTYKLVRRNATTYEIWNTTTGSGYSTHGGRSGGYHVGNINIVIAGIIFSGLILALIIVCFWHRNTRKPSSTTASERSCSQYWDETASAPPIDLLTISSQEQYFQHGIFLHEGDQCHCGIAERVRTTQMAEPPPSYETVIKTHVEPKRDDTSECHSRRQSLKQNGDTMINNVCVSSDETGLPSYEAALRLESGNYL